MASPSAAPATTTAGQGRDLPRFRTATTMIETTLRTAILEGRIAGGTPLRQEDLAARFGTSRMPVREALRQLEAQALVEFLPHRGAVVAEISAADALDVTAVRAALEPVALALSIPHLTATDLDRARDLIADMDSEPDPGRMGELNRRFHMTLYAQAGRPRLLALVEQHLAAADRSLRYQLAALGRAEMSQHEHQALLAAVAERRIADAGALLARHIERAGATLAQFLAERGPRQGTP
ncbi:MAG: GntR family transcriptional regulator [Azospirillaceae bacterium]|nr:GntR family transcriptional regulator [Azospirillaceae bacterium]